MRTNRRTVDKDPIYNAVLAAMRKKGKGFFIISCGAWIHPANTVLNCYAIIFDGFIEYKFELTTECKFRVAEIRNRSWLDLNVTTDQILTQDELVKKIREAN